MMETKEPEDNSIMTVDERRRILTRIARGELTLTKPEFDQREAAIILLNKMEEMGNAETEEEKIIVIRPQLTEAERETLRQTALENRAQATALPAAAA